MSLWWLCLYVINRQWHYNCWELHVHNICITKLWALRSYFIYLHGFLLTLFYSITVQFSMFFHVSNLIQIFKTGWVDPSTQSSLVIYNSCYTDYHLSCQSQCIYLGPKSPTDDQTDRHKTTKIPQKTGLTDEHTDYTDTQVFWTRGMRLYAMRTNRS